MVKTIQSNYVFLLSVLLLNYSCVLDCVAFPLFLLYTKLESDSSSGGGGDCMYVGGNSGINL